MPLQKELDVPLGLLVGAVGGTPSGAWLTEEHFNAHAACKAEVEKALAKYNPEEDKREIRAGEGGLRKVARHVQGRRRR